MRYRIHREKPRFVGVTTLPSFPLELAGSGPTGRTEWPCASARVRPKLVISTRSSGLLISMMSVHGPSPSAPVFTNLNIQATHPPSAREQTRKYLTGRHTPNLATVPTKEVADGSEVGPLLDQVAASVASFTADGAYDQDSVSTAVAEHHPEAAIIVPPRSTAVPSETAETAPTQRDHHLQFIAEHGQAAWQKASGYTPPGLVSRQPSAGSSR